LPAAGRFPESREAAVRYDQPAPGAGAGAARIWPVRLSLTPTTLEPRESLASDLGAKAFMFSRDSPRFGGDAVARPALLDADGSIGLGYGRADRLDVERP
jgi:hypothetical protein